MKISESQVVLHFLQPTVTHGFNILGGKKKLLKSKQRVLFEAHPHSTNMQIGSNLKNLKLNTCWILNFLCLFVCRARFCESDFLHHPVLQLECDKQIVNICGDNGDDELIHLEANVLNCAKCCTNSNFVLHFCGCSTPTESAQEEQSAARQTNTLLNIKPSLDDYLTRSI